MSPLLLGCSILSLLHGGAGVIMRNLTCYDCSESWPRLYVPYTACQSNLSTVRQMICHPLDQYCLVEVTSKNRIWTSLVRRCATTCLWGCRLSNLGVTSMTCRTCCQSNLCNIGNAAPQAPAPTGLAWPAVLLVWVLRLV